MVMAVSFERYGRLYYLDAGDISARVGDKVLVPTDDGTEVAECVWAPQYVDDEIGGLPRLGGVCPRAPPGPRGGKPPAPGGGARRCQEAGQAARAADEDRGRGLSRSIRSAPV